jgi:hypothetical protein
VERVVVGKKEGEKERGGKWDCIQKDKNGRQYDARYQQWKT